MQYPVGVPGPPRLHSGCTCGGPGPVTEPWGLFSVEIPDTERGFMELVNGNGSGPQLTLFHMGALPWCLVKGGLPAPLVCLDKDLGHSCLCLLLIS